MIQLVNVGPDTVIDGLTIGDVNWVGRDGSAGTQADGTQGTPVQGGIMTVISASPTIRNCRFIDCSITGGDGGAGDAGNTAHPAGYDGGYAGWAYGGALYIAFGSNPIFENCLFENCRVFGGNGGNGGNGTNNAHGGLGGNWMLSESIMASIRSWWDGWQYGLFDRDG
jgi:hypothetical protein